MSEIELTQRINSLEKELGILKGQKYESMKRTAVDCIRSSYPNADERMDMVYESACLHVQVSDADTQSDVNRKIEEEVRSICRKYNLQEPSNSSVDIKDYWDKMQRKEEGDRKYAEEVRNSFAK